MWITHLVPLGLLLATGADRGGGLIWRWRLLPLLLLVRLDRTGNAGATRAVAKGDSTAAVAGGRASVCVAGHVGGWWDTWSTKRRARDTDGVGTRDNWQRRQKSQNRDPVPSGCGCRGQRWKRGTSGQSQRHRLLSGV